MTDKFIFPAEVRAEYVTRENWTNFSKGLSVLAAYQGQLSEDAPLFIFREVDGDEIGEPDMQALVATANVPGPTEVHPKHVEGLHRLGWYLADNWQYRLTLLPKR